jgi:dienelactone hydrolase
MNQLYKLCACLLLACLLGNKVGFTQTHTAKPTRINSNCGGFYEYLPAGYNPSGSTLYPLIVYLGGNGSNGSGSVSDLNTYVLQYGLTKNIKEGKFPASVTSGGTQYRFVVVSPQFAFWPVASDVAAVVAYAKKNYKVDTNRVYVTGFSQGGGVAWEYAGSSSAVSLKLAAIVPVCGATTPNQTTSTNIARGNLPVWATHNNADNAVPVSNTNTIITQINDRSPVPPNPRAKKTIFTQLAVPTDPHDAWTRTYDASYREGGMNIYEWMLQYQREEQLLPVDLTNYKILSSDRQGVTIGWTTAAEQNNAYFTIERSTDGESFTAIGKVNGTNLATGSNYTFTDSRPVSGNNFYRLVQTDFDGRTKSYSILSTVIDFGLTSGKFTLFPNPASRSITVGFNHPDKDRLFVKIINTQGMVVQATQYNKETGYWQQNINVDRLAAGQYFIQVKGSVFESTQTLVIEK